jgi:hypothetical protein
MRLPAKKPLPPKTKSKTMPMILSFSQWALAQAVRRTRKVISAIINQLVE